MYNWPIIFQLYFFQQEDDNNGTNPDFIFILKPVFENLQTHMKYRWFNRYLSHFLEKVSAEYTPLLKKKEDDRELGIVNIYLRTFLVRLRNYIV